MMAETQLLPKPIPNLNPNSIEKVFERGTATILVLYTTTMPTAQFSTWF